MVGISRPVVKHSFLVKQTEDIPQVLKKAFWLAASGRPCDQWSLIYRKIFLIRRTNYPMLGLSWYVLGQSHYYRT